MRLISYCLPATDQVIRIKFTRSCFRLTLRSLNPKALHPFRSSSVLTQVRGHYILIVGGVLCVIANRGHYVLRLGGVMSGALYLGGVMAVNR